MTEVSNVQTFTAEELHEEQRKAFRYGLEQGRLEGRSEAALPTLLTAAEVATILRTSPYHVVLLCRNGDLRATRPGEAWLIDAGSVREYLAAASNGGVE